MDTYGSRYVRERLEQNFVQAFVCGQFQPCTSAPTNSTPGLALTLTLPPTLTLTLTLTLWVAFFQKNAVRPKDPP